MISLMNVEILFKCSDSKYKKKALTKHLQQISFNTGRIRTKNI